MSRNLSNIIIWMYNRPGVLFRVLLVFRRKMFNIESATVGPTEVEGVSRITITVNSTHQAIENLSRYLSKMVDVVKVETATDDMLVARELAMVKIALSSNDEKQEILKLTEHFRARVICMTQKMIVLETTGSEDKIDAFYENLKNYKIIEFVRTGRTALYK